MYLVLAIVELDAASKPKESDHRPISNTHTRQICRGIITGRGKYKIDASRTRRRINLDKLVAATNLYWENGTAIEPLIHLINAEYSAMGLEWVEVVLGGWLNLGN